MLIVDVDVDVAASSFIYTIYQDVGPLKRDNAEIVPATSTSGDYVVVRSGMEKEANPIRVGLLR